MNKIINYVNDDQEVLEIAMNARYDQVEEDDDQNSGEDEYDDDFMQNEEENSAIHEHDRDMSDADVRDMSDADVKDNDESDDDVYSEEYGVKSDEKDQHKDVYDNVKDFSELKKQHESYDSDVPKKADISKDGKKYQKDNDEIDEDIPSEIDDDYHFY